ncbi:unnamed protein product, partial [Pelagomonas calceolata]
SVVDAYGRDRRSEARREARREARPGPFLFWGLAGLCPDRKGAAARIVLHSLLAVDLVLGSPGLGGEGRVAERLVRFQVLGAFAGHLALVLELHVDLGVPAARGLEARERVRVRVRVVLAFPRAAPPVVPLAFVLRGEQEVGLLLLRGVLVRLRAGQCDVRGPLEHARLGRRGRAVPVFGAVDVLARVPPDDGVLAVQERLRVAARVGPRLLEGVLDPRLGVRRAPVRLACDGAEVAAHGHVQAHVRAHVGHALERVRERAARARLEVRHRAAAAQHAGRARPVEEAPRDLEVAHVRDAPQAVVARLRRQVVAVLPDVGVVLVLEAPPAGVAAQRPGGRRRREGEPAAHQSAGGGSLLLPSYSGIGALAQLAGGSVVVHRQ